MLRDWMSSGALDGPGQGRSEDARIQQAMLSEFTLGRTAVGPGEVPDNALGHAHGRGNSNGSKHSDDKQHALHVAVRCAAQAL